MKQITLLASIFMLSIIGYSQKVKQDSLGNYYSVNRASKPVLLKMNTDSRGLISCQFKDISGEEKAFDYMTFDEFNKYFGLEYTGKIYLTKGEKYHVYTSKSGKLFILRTSKNTGLIYKNYLNL